MQKSQRPSGGMRGQWYKFAPPQMIVQNPHETPHYALLKQPRSPGLLGNWVHAPHDSDFGTDDHLQANMSQTSSTITHSFWGSPGRETSGRRSYFKYHTCGVLKIGNSVESHVTLLRNALQSIYECLGPNSGLPLRLSLPFVAARLKMPSRYEKSRVCSGNVGMWEYGCRSFP
jgi:hypothetical protein